MNQVVTNSGAAAQYYDVSKTMQNKKAAKAENNAAPAKKSSSTAADKTNTYDNLSTKAKALLDELKDKYTNMDFFVADFSSDEEAQSIMSAGTKDFSALFTGDELEKMANDESYKQERLDMINDALEKFKQLKEQLANKETEDGQNGASYDDIVKVGIAFHDDGTVSYFAELEKSTAKQKERIEDAKDAKAEEKKKAAQKEKAADQKETVKKKTKVQASSYEELLDKLPKVDWNTVKEEATQSVGQKFDLSVQEQIVLKMGHNKKGNQNDDLESIKVYCGIVQRQFDQ